MNEKSKKMDAIISENRVKLHVFEPTQRQIWTIVGREKEHWLDPDSNFCSCSGYYFGMLKNKKPCYHIDSIKIAKEKTLYENIEFSDEEFESFVSGLINDL